MNLIPFGKDKTTGRLLDVSEVAKGEQCGCVCPSCSSQLVARQGEKIEWHFAHKKDYQKGTRGPCQYSWFVALRMMIRQILSEQKELYLPEYSKYHPLKRKSIVVTQPQTLHYEQCITDVLEKGEHHSFDAKLFIREHPLHIFVSYKGRDYRGYHQGQSVEGIIEIDLRGLTLRRQKRLTEDSCLAQLRYMLKNPHPCKRWLFHKRELDIIASIEADIAEKKKQKAAKRAAQRERTKAQSEKSKRQNSEHSLRAAQHINNQRLPTVASKEFANTSAKQLESTRSIIEQTKPVDVDCPHNSSYQDKTPKPKAEAVKDKPYYCIVCKHKYMGTKVGRNPCPLCNEHLYRRAL